jgi:rod shape-determining protein MreC
VQVGDTVETRGGDRIFPAGVLVGVVTEVNVQPGSNYHEILIELAEDMTRSTFVYVVKDLQRAERDTLEQAHQVP